MENPTPHSVDQYSPSEVVDYLLDAEIPADDISRNAGKESEILVNHTFRSNRREIFTHLIEHGWAITSIGSSNGHFWLEQLDESDAVEEKTYDVTVYDNIRDTTRVVTFDNFKDALLYVKGAHSDDCREVRDTSVNRPNCY